MTTEEKTLKELARNVKIEVSGDVQTPYEKQDEWQQNANGYRCTLKYKGRKYSFDFWHGVAINSDPTAEGCLECLLSDAHGADNTFEDFCGEFGYDTDSRKAERIYKACIKVRENMERLLGDDFEAFLYAERD